MHEFIHAFGHYHEQSRPDRDLYIEVQWNNINESYYSQYAIAEGTATYGVMYDAKSIMHYKTSFFANSPSTGPTMISLVRFNI